MSGPLQGRHVLPAGAVRGGEAGLRLDATHRALGAIHELGHEARAQSDDHAALKLWLRMLSCVTEIQAEIRGRLRERFGISLARFDYLAQVHRHPEGLKMNELSRQLMVTGGNVTTLTDDLETEGLVVRESSPTDRRAWIVRLTPRGQRAFEAMAQVHEQWILELFAGLDARAVRQLHHHLGVLRMHVHDEPSD